MATNLRVGRTHAYQPYREVEPVPAYPRIDPQQPREEYPGQRDAHRDGSKEHVARRFNAMRKLIDELRQGETLSRVDYMTAEQELVELALMEADSQQVRTVLADAGLIVESTEDCFQQLRQRTAVPVLKPEGRLTEEMSLLPVFVPGLTAFRLCMSEVHVRVGDRTQAVHEAMQRDGFLTFERGRIRFELHPDDPQGVNFSLDISILVAASEVDEAGRKAILYQRRDQTFALYADKQISLSI